MRATIPILLTALAVPLLAACASEEKPIAPAEQAPLLVDAAWLAAHRDDDNLVIVDMQNKRESYEKGHLKGAVFAHIQDFRDDEIKDLLPTDALTRKLGELGIDENTHVVVYDDKRGRNATWLWYTLMQLGHGAVSLLDEPFEELQLVQEPAEVEQKRYRPRKNPTDVVDANYVKARIGKTLMLDARPPGQYTGEKPKKKMRGGHVEGALNVPYTSFFGEDGKALPIEASRRKLHGIVGREIDPDEEILLYCNSYQEAANVHFHLVRMGFRNIKAYDASMKDWEKRGLALKKGEQP